MLKRLLCTAAIAALWVTSPKIALAQDNPVVVELFTSQGCSSCPPADKLMQKLAARDDVIALALHVDYWDYIGWKDEYADSANTVRQQDYAYAAGRKMIYTPQMVVNGLDDVVGTRSMELADLISLHKSKPDTVALSIARDGDALHIQANAQSVLSDGPYLVQMVRFSPARKAHITRGENAGRDLTFVNVVESWTVLDEWDGRTALDLETKIEGDLPVVVLIQKTGPGAIMAAAQLD